MTGRFLRYSAVSGIGTLTYLALFFLFISIRLNAVYASALAFVPALVLQFALNYGWTFASRSRRLPAFSKFTVVSLSGLALNLIVMHVGANLARIDVRYVVLAALLIVAMNNYTLNRIWSFR